MRRILELIYIVVVIALGVQVSNSVDRYLGPRIVAIFASFPDFRADLNAALAGLSATLQGAPQSWETAVKIVDTDKEFASGVHIGDGVILTARHVWEPDNDFVEAPDGKRFKIDGLLWRCDFCDLLTFKVVGPFPYPASPLACREPKRGEPINYTGYPEFPSLGDYEPRGTYFGHVLDGEFFRDPSGDDAIFLATVYATFGASGSPVVDKHNRVLGVISTAFHASVLDPRRMTPNKVQTGTAGVSSILPYCDPNKVARMKEIGGSPRE